MDIVERLNEMIGKGEYYDPEFQQAKAEIERLREQERKMTNHAIDRMAEMERLRDQIDQLQDRLSTCQPIASLGHGCVCPVGAEKTCSGPLCPRSNWPVTAT